MGILCIQNTEELKFLLLHCICKCTVKSVEMGRKQKNYIDIYSDRVH